MSAARTIAADGASQAAVWAVLGAVPDPEIPALSVVDLGMIRGVEVDGERIVVGLTPTYTGCPATDVIASDITKALNDAGFADVTADLLLSPAWTTDWITEDGHKKLRDYGIAPPVRGSGSKMTLFGDEPAIACPRCGDSDTEMVSAFGSTPCKAHYKCRACAEPFDYFKCL
ncbi:MAG: phenylacetate-CoA oxygenase subunit PaaJ [Fimbriimonadaceae bacterium]|nr:phenylacetate-CoA oxygenase subunit PaaJ [Alphaproteobacteria bacterium]